MSCHLLQSNAIPASLGEIDQVAFQMMPFRSRVDPSFWVKYVGIWKDRRVH